MWDLADVDSFDDFFENITAKEHAKFIETLLNAWAGKQVEHTALLYQLNTEDHRLAVLKAIVARENICSLL